MEREAERGMGNYSVVEVISDVGREDVDGGGADDEVGEKTPNVDLPLLSSLNNKLYVSTQIKNSIRYGNGASFQLSIIPIHFQRINGLEMEAYHVGPCIADLELVLVLGFHF
ncbi:hypothetical protein ACFX15_013060 [Malus domestica]